MSGIWAIPSKGKIDVGGVQLEFSRWGPAPDIAPTLIFLHEGLGCVEQWRDLPEQLAAATGFGVLAYSRAGHGGSDPITLPRPLNFLTREALDIVGPLLDKAEVRQVILFGHSDGATIATIYAGSVSDLRVRGLILIAPHFFTEPTGLVAISAAKQAYEKGDLKSKLARYHQNPDIAFYGWHDVWTHPNFENWNVADAIDHLRIPVLAIQGDDDPYGTIAQISEIEERIYSPVETLILEGCGHAPHVERAEETASAITEFCARWYRLECEEVAIA